jgi:hypothetical protein
MFPLLAQALDRSASQAFVIERLFEGAFFCASPPLHHPFTNNSLELIQLVLVPCEDMKLMMY